MPVTFTNCPANPPGEQCIFATKRFVCPISESHDCLAMDGDPMNCPHFAKAAEAQPQVRATNIVYRYHCIHWKQPGHKLALACVNRKKRTGRCCQPKCVLSKGDLKPVV
jgi:hypothetical protein